jgi:hypothetical protein
MILTPVQSRNEDDFVALLQLVIEFSFKFPIGIVDQDQNPWAAERRVE